MTRSKDSKDSRVVVMVERRVTSFRNYSVQQLLQKLRPMYVPDVFH
jgi:hypothetical protein